MRKLLTVLAGAVMFAAVVYLYYTEVKPTVIFGLRSDYAHAIPFQKVPAGLDSLRAESCGTCHKDIYEEWKTSIHSQAFTDPFFQAYWNRDKHTWVCLNCHAPLQNQQPTLINEIPRGRVERAPQAPNPHFDAAYEQEGVTCAACHVRDGVVLGPFDDSAAPHPTRFDPTFRTTEVCYRCHSVVSGPAQFYNGGPCGTYAEYEGKFFMQERGMICQSCHMPEITRPVAKDGPIRNGRQHLWRGGHDPDMVKRAMAIQVVADPPMPEPGKDVRITLTLINAGAGHKLPTGDPDRHFTVEFYVEDAAKQVVTSQSATMGRWIMWQPAIVELYDNRLLPLASREYTFTYRVPADPQNLTVRTRVQYHIQTERQHSMLMNKFGLTASDPYNFVVYEREAPLTGNLSAAFQDDRPDSRLACAAPNHAS